MLRKEKSSEVAILSRPVKVSAPRQALDGPRKHATRPLTWFP